MNAKHKKIVMRSLLFAKSIICLLLVLSSSAFSKDLSSRLGVGIKNNFSQNMPGLASVYYPNSEIGITGGISMDTEKNASRFGLSGGVRRIVFREDHMNFYFGGQLGIVNYELAAKDNPTQIEKQSGFEMQGVFGGEFFLSGLDSLGFTFEGGVGISSLKDVRFRTIADHPFKAGIIFYF